MVALYCLQGLDGGFSMAKEIEVVYRTFEIPNIDDLRQRYGVQFTPASAELLRSFDEQCASLKRERLAHGPATDEDKPAVAYRPSYFLAQPLTTEQTIAINRHETHAIADYCVAVQDQLARVPIKESLERFVHLPLLFEAEQISASFSPTPFHAACGEWAGKPREFWVREGVAQRLTLMGKLVGTIGLQLYFEDAFRPVGVQEGLFKRRFEWTKSAHPDWTEEQMLAEARSKTATTPRLASHKGGAAIDARLQDKQTGQILDFGHEYPDGGALVFPASPFVTAEQWRNRQLFQVAAGLSGLTLYVGEDWHVSYGDNLASLDENGVVRTDYTAKYGPVKKFDPTTGSITELYEASEIDVVFAH